VTACNRALALLDELRALLTGLVALAKDERVLLRKLDPAALFALAERRAALGQEAAARVQTLHKLRAENPEPDERVAKGLAEVRGLAADLKTAALLNQELAQRSLQLVSGLLRVLRPQSATYDRRGAGLAPVQSGLQSTRA